MFVVRIIRDSDETDYKAFDKMSDAQNRFDQAYSRTHRGEFESVAIFEAVGEQDVRRAVEKVKNAHEGFVQLLKIKECNQTELVKLDEKLILP